MSNNSFLSPPDTHELCKKQIKEQFLVDMPEDFTLFWDFCKTLNPSHPECMYMYGWGLLFTALWPVGYVKDTNCCLLLSTVALMPSLKLELVGPFHVLRGLLRGVPWQQCVLHYRYFYDPPEFITVLSSHDDKGFHLGYFRLVLMKVCMLEGLLLPYGEFVLYM